MKTVVVGGSGLIGTQLVTLLRAHGHEVRVASSATGVDSASGRGLADAVASAYAVADVTNTSSPDAHAAMRFFSSSARNIVAASQAAGVRHLVVLSVVGTDLLTESPYFRAKLAQETAVRAGLVRFTIVRATQFFEFADGIAQAADPGDVLRVPETTVQPVASRDVAAALAEILADAPVDGIVEVAGPEQMSLAEFVGRSLAARGDPRTVTADPGARYFGATLRPDALIPARPPRLGRMRLAEWLRAGSERN
jgi:uncharacterized protein YbjT (DUF2867 family)